MKQKTKSSLYWNRTSIWLIGLMREGDGIGANVLESLELSLDVIRDETQNVFV